MIMEKEKVYQMTNDFGRNYLQTWLKNQEFLGVESYTENSRKEFFLIYKYENGGVYVCVLPLAENENNGCCSFGDLKYFANVFAQNESGIDILWNPIYGCPVFPRWRNDVSVEKKNEFHERFCALIKKYS